MEFERFGYFITPEGIHYIAMDEQVWRENAPPGTVETMLREGFVPAELCLTQNPGNAISYGKVSPGESEYWTVSEKVSMPVKQGVAVSMGKVSEFMKYSDFGIAEQT